MADWTKLNKEFDNVINNLSDEEWDEFVQLVNKKKKKSKL